MAIKITREEHEKIRAGLRALLVSLGHEPVGSGAVGRDRSGELFFNYAFVHGVDKAVHLVRFTLTAPDRAEDHYL